MLLDNHGQLQQLRVVAIGSLDLLELGQLGGVIEALAE
jgi:hypothetical protein